MFSADINQVVLSIEESPNWNGSISEGLEVAYQEDKRLNMEVIRMCFQLKNLIWRGFSSLGVVSNWGLIYCQRKEKKWWAFWKFK